MYNTIFDHEGHILPAITTGALFNLAQNSNTPSDILREIWAHRTEEKVHANVFTALTQRPLLPYSLAFEMLRDGVYIPEVLIPNHNQFKPTYYY